jgi:hypothetical protein
LDDALVKAQSQIKHASKEGINPHFKSKYADLGSVFDACREALTKAGIAVTQWPAASDDGKLHLITRLSHKGEWMQCKMGIPMDKQNAHGVGSAITYARRYALSAALGIVADEDDDGNAAVAKPKVQAPPEEDEDVKQGAINWMRDERGSLNVMTIAEEVKDWRKRKAKPLAKLEANYPDIYEQLMQSYDLALERVTGRVQ